MNGSLPPFGHFRNEIKIQNEGVYKGVTELEKTDLATPFLVLRILKERDGDRK